MVGLGERGRRVKSMPVERVTSNDIRPILAEYARHDGILMTDEEKVYLTPGKKFVAHHAVQHGIGEYSRRVGDLRVHTNTIEGFFS